MRLTCIVPVFLTLAVSCAGYAHRFVDIFERVHVQRHFMCLFLGTKEHQSAPTFCISIRGFTDVCVLVLAQYGVASDPPIV